MHILAVDDDNVSLLKLQELLSMYGDCEIAENGIRALEMFKNAHKKGSPYKFITLDIEMPQMSGPALIREIRKWEAEHHISKDEEVKILMMTVKNDINSLTSSYNEGCSGYCTKPIKPEYLRDALKLYGII